METPRTASTATIPSTRETIDLISDDEGDIHVKKKDPSSSPDNIPTVPVSITMRKRVKMGDIQDETPSRPPPLKKQKSPSEASLITPRSPSTQHQPHPPIIPSRDFSPQPDPFGQSTFTQIPDSEGEDDADICLEDLNSDDIPLETKEILGGTSSISNPATEPNNRDELVPESPMKVDNVGEFEKNGRNGTPPANPSGTIVPFNPQRSIGTSSAISLVSQLETTLMADDPVDFTSENP